MVDVLRSLVSDELTRALVEQGGRIPEQKRLVTALFADLSGFTPLSGRLDPETLAATVDPLLAGLTRAVRRGEGYVGSFAGDALLAFFGAPTAHEDDVERALRCALQMLHEWPALQEAAGEHAQALSLRIGVDTGHVLARLLGGDVRTDYAVMGNAVNMAQRLQSQAPQGACYVGETTARLAADAFELASVGDLQVKGRAEPLPAYLLVGERRRTVLRRAALGTPLRGRDDELAALRARVSAPTGGVVLVGEAGAGKSRLLDAVRPDAAAWREGGCAAHDDTSYRPWRAALDGLEAQGIDVLRGAAWSGTPSARRALVARDVAAALRSVAPVVVVLEDLHWADAPTLDLLHDLLPDLADDPVLLLGTSRSPVDGVTPLQVGPLPAAAVGVLVEDVLGAAPAPSLVEDVARRSGGNPFYAAELARALVAAGVVRYADGDVLVAPESELARTLELVPASLEGLVGARIDALSAAAESVLTVAAVLGPPLSVDVVAAVAARATGASVLHVERQVRELTEAGLLAGEGFAHAIVQDAAYTRTPRRRRRELHLAAAEVGPDLPAFQARHLYLGGAGTRAVAALERAAEDAAARSVLEEAVLHLGREVELRRADDTERAVLPDRLTVLGEHLETLGRYEEAEPVLREAQALGAGGRATRALAGVLRRRGAYDEVLQVTDVELADPEQAGLLREERGWALAATGRHDAALQLVATPAASPRLQGRWDLLRAYCSAAAGRPADAVTAAGEAHDLLLSVGDLPGAARALRLLGDAQWRLGQHEQALASLTEGRRRSQELGAWEEVAACTSTLATLHNQRGDLETSLAEGRAATVVADRIGHRFGRVVTRANVADTLLAMGSATEALVLAEQAAQMALDAGLPGLRWAAEGTAAEALRVVGRPEEAAARAAAAAEGLELAGQQREAAEVWRTVAAAATDDALLRRADERLRALAQDTPLPTP